MIASDIASSDSLLKDLTLSIFCFAITVLPKFPIDDWRLISFSGGLLFAKGLRLA
jgi:hypothetical protein